MKFTIRDLFLVTLVVALVLGWWVERRKYENLRRSYIEHLDKSEANFRMLETNIEMLIKSKAFSVRAARLRDWNPIPHSHLRPTM